MQVTVCINKLDDVTGTETYCLDLLDELAASGHEADVFTLRSAPAIAARVKATNARLSTYPAYPSRPADRLIVMHPLATTLLLRRMPAGVPTLALIHSPWPDEYPVRLHRIDKFVAVSPFIADLLRTKHRIRAEDIAVIPNGVDTAHYDAAPVPRPPLPVRVLWASVYHPDRHEALVAVVNGVLQRDDLRLKVIDAHLPPGLVPEHERIEVVSKRPDSKGLLEDADVVCALGPGRILLEALAMNRAALCLNAHRKGEYMGGDNRGRLEYYLSDWGRPVRELLTPEEVARNGNRRSVATRYYDKSVNFGELIAQLERLDKRTSSPVSYRVSDLKRMPYLAREYAVLLESNAGSERGSGVAQTGALAIYRATRRMLPPRLRHFLHRLAG